jgi:hypothetical protein
VRAGAVVVVVATLQTPNAQDVPARQFAGSDFLGANNQMSHLCDDPARRRFAIALAMQDLGR